MHTDFLISFQLEKAPVRGRFVRLQHSVNEVLQRHQYPNTVAALTAEAATLAPLMGGLMDETGLFTLQARGGGPLSLLIADYFAPGGIRAYARFDSSELSVVPQGFEDLLGSGHLAFTMDPENSTEQYQGIVPIEGASLSTSAENYFWQSEQIFSRINLAVAQDGPEWQTGGILLQALPGKAEDGDHDLDNAPIEWDAACALLATCTPEELVNAELHPHDLLYRLFNELGVRVHETTPLQARCRCSYERAQRVLASVTASERAELAENGQLTMNCEFCGTVYTLDADSKPTP